jgi:hypothetical protein
MLPPSDSLLHHKLKLAEALSNIQAIEVPPPPSYSERTVMPVTRDSFHAYSTTAEDDDDEDDDDDDNNYDDNDDDDNDEKCLAPITIHIDASIGVDGQGNTLILGPPNATNANSAGADPCADQPSNIQAPARTASTGYGYVHGQTHAERLTSTILTALKDARGAAGRRPWEININAGVSVNGERNVAIMGARGGGQGARKEGRDVLEQRRREREDWKREVDGGVMDGSRKRRAESVSVYQLGPSALMERLLIMIHVVLGTCGGAESEKGQTLNGSPRDRANTERRV